MTPNTNMRIKRNSKGQFAVGQRIRLGVKHTDEAKRKMSEAKKGKHLSEEHKRKVSEALKGKTPKNFSEFQKKGHEAMKGSTPWNKGKKMSQDIRLKQSNARKKFLANGGTVWNKGKKGAVNSGSFQEGEKHPFWEGGKSFEPYGTEFNDKLKEQIRKRDNYICQECGQTEKQLGYKLSIHHIDYNKKNNNPSNLIALCRSCHSQTNFGRKDWTNYFQSKMNQTYEKNI